MNIPTKHLYARIPLDLYNPQQKRDLTLQLIALLRLQQWDAPLAAKRRAYRRIPKGCWVRQLKREMEGLVNDMRRRMVGEWTS